MTRFAVGVVVPMPTLPLLFALLIMNAGEELPETQETNCGDVEAEVPGAMKCRGVVGSDADHSLKIC